MRLTWTRAPWRTLMAVALASMSLAAVPVAAAPPALQPTAEATPLTVADDQITTVVTVPVGAPSLYVVGGQGLYRAPSAGGDWEQVGPAPPPGRVIGSADGSSILLAGDHPPCGRGGDVTPLSRSADGGASWETVAGVTDLRPLAVWGEANFAVGATCSGLQLSTDGGTSWAPSDVLEAGAEVTAFSVIADAAGPSRQALVGVTGEGGTSRLYLLDFADPAQPVASGVLKEYWGLGAVAGMAPQFVLGAADGVWLSIDSGQNWTLRRTGLEEVTLSVDPLVELLPDDELERGFGINDVVLSPQQANVMFAATIDGLFMTDDAGATWERVAGIEGTVTTLVIAPERNEVLAEAEAGAFVVTLPMRPSAMVGD